MKHLITLLSFLIFVSCNTNTDSGKITESVLQENIELEKRDFFNKHIANRNCNDGSCNGDSTTDFKKFMQNFYPLQKAINLTDPLIYALEEPYIDSNKLDNSKQWMRITVDGTWSIPYCVIAEYKNSKTYITFKTTDGSGGYFPGTLESAQTLTFNDSVYRKAFNDISNLNFWQLKHDCSNYCATDGTLFTFEALDKGKYNLVNFYSPRSCGNDTTKKLESINFWLQSFVNVEKAYNIRVRKKSGS